MGNLQTPNNKKTARPTNITITFVLITSKFSFTASLPEEQSSCF